MLSRKKKRGQHTKGRHPGKAFHAGRILAIVRSSRERGASFNDILRRLHIRDGKGIKSLEHGLRELLQRGSLVKRKGRYFLPQPATAIGRIIAHPKGFGFVRLGEDRASDVFVPEEQMRGLIDGDVVEVRVAMRRGRKFAEVLRIVEPASNLITGQVRLQAGAIFLEPRSKRMPFLLPADAPGISLHEGDWVRAEILRNAFPLRARILNPLKDVQSPDGLIDIVIHDMDLPTMFPAEVLSEAESIPPVVSKKEQAGRLDLTSLPFVTIDGADAKDFDDAICVLPRGDGFEAWVAIADVAHYVRSGSELDREAKKRGNSFYFPNRVLPMLPERLSNGICSLNPRVPRLAMAVRMRYDANGRRRSIRCHEAVIRSHARLTYEQADAWITHGDESAIEDRRVRDMLKDAERLFNVMLIKHRERGALELDTPEVRASIHEGAIHALEVRKRNLAHRLIEEMMLAANTAVAQLLMAANLPFIYRVHEPPSMESIAMLNDYLAPFGLSIPMRKSGVRPGDIQHILDVAADTSLGLVLPRLVLRAMKQARYSTVNKGHFGLAFKAYCHFTSPIRRYADLLVHRALKAMLKGTKPLQDKKQLEAIALHLSLQERKQAQAEWDTTAMLAALYHSKDVGRTFPAIISGVSERFVFCELEPTLAEGCLPVEGLPGRYVLDVKMHRLVDRATGRGFNLGDPLLVRIDATDPVRGRITLSLAQNRPQG